MSNNIIWFNIGQKGDHFVTWQCAMIEDNFDPNTIRFEDWVWNENNEPIQKWVKKEDLNVKLHRSVEKAFEDLDKVAKWIKINYETGEDVYVGGRNWTHIYEVFDMDNKNEYGVAEPIEWR